LVVQRYPIIQAILMEHAAFDPELGYCQGMNWIAAVISVCSPDQRVASMRFRRFVDSLRGIWLPDFPYLQTGALAFAVLYRDCLPGICEHLNNNGVFLEMFLPEVWLTLFARWLPFQFLGRILEFIEAERLAGIISVTLVVLTEHAEALLRVNDFYGLFMGLKTLGRRVHQPSLEAVINGAKEFLPLVEKTLPPRWETLRSGDSKRSKKKALRIKREASCVVHTDSLMNVIVKDDGNIPAMQQVATELRRYHGQEAPVLPTGGSRSQRKNPFFQMCGCWEKCEEECIDRS